MSLWPNWSQVDYQITHRAQAMARSKRHYSRADSNKAADSLIRRLYGRNAIVDREVTNKVRDLLWNTYDGPTGYRGYHLESVAKKGRRKMQALGYPVRFNSMTKKKTTKRKNAAPKSRTLSLRNFSGKVRLNPDKTVSVLGVGKRGAAKKKAAKRRTR